MRIKSKPTKEDVRISASDQHKTSASGRCSIKTSSPTSNLKPNQINKARTKAGQPAAILFNADFGSSFHGKSSGPGSPAFVIKWMQDGVFQPIRAEGALRLYGPNVIGYFYKNNRADVPWQSSDADVGLKYSSTDSQIQTKTTSEEVQLSDASIPTSIACDPSPLEDDSPVEMDILDLSCKDTIDYAAILSWPSFIFRQK